MTLDVQGQYMIDLGDGRSLQALLRVSMKSAVELLHSVLKGINSRVLAEQTLRLLLVKPPETFEFVHLRQRRSRTQKPLHALFVRLLLILLIPTPAPLH